MDSFAPIVRFIRSAAGAIVFLLVGLGMVAGAVVLLVAYLPEGVRDLRAYEAATPCRTVPIEPADCLWNQEFTVTEVDDPRGRAKGRYTILTDADGDRWRSTYGNPGPVWRQLAKGDHVTGTIWHGTLTEISEGDASQSTSQAPSDMRALSALTALMLLPSGLSLAIVSAWRFTRRRASPTLTPGQSASFCLSFALFMAGLLSAALAALLPYDSELEHVGFTALIWATDRHPHGRPRPPPHHPSGRPSTCGLTGSGRLPLRPGGGLAVGACLGVGGEGDQKGALEDERLRAVLEKVTRPLDDHASPRCSA